MSLFGKRFRVKCAEYFDCAALEGSFLAPDPSESRSVTPQPGQASLLLDTTDWLTGSQEIRKLTPEYPDCGKPQLSRANSPWFDPLEALSPRECRELVDLCP